MKLPDRRLGSTVRRSVLDGPHRRPHPRPRPPARIGDDGIHPPEHGDLYEAIAPSYDRLHARFLRLAGGGAQAALDGAATALLRPGLAALDAGCGTSRLGRRLMAAEPHLNLTLLDAAPAMLRHARDVSARRVHGSLTHLPFADGAFDLTLSAWTIETVWDIRAALIELVRVTAPGGHLCLAFCADIPGCDLLARAMIRAVRTRGTGVFLDPTTVTLGARTVLRPAGPPRRLRRSRRGARRRPRPPLRMRAPSASIPSMRGEWSSRWIVLAVFGVALAVYALGFLTLGRGPVEAFSIAVSHVAPARHRLLGGLAGATEGPLDRTHRAALARP